MKSQKNTKTGKQCIGTCMSGVRKKMNFYEQLFDENHKIEKFFDFT